MNKLVGCVEKRDYLWADPLLGWPFLIYRSKNLLLEAASFISARAATGLLKMGGLDGARVLRSRQEMSQPSPERATPGQGRGRGYGEGGMMAGTLR